MKKIHKLPNGLLVYWKLVILDFVTLSLISKPDISENPFFVMMSACLPWLEVEAQKKIVALAGLQSPMEYWHCFTNKDVTINPF